MFALLLIYSQKWVELALRRANPQQLAKLNVGIARDIFEACELEVRQRLRQNRAMIDEAKQAAAALSAEGSAPESHRSARRDI
jgi:hypothetical protein